MDDKKMEGLGAFFCFVVACIILFAVGWLQTFKAQGVIENIVRYSAIIGLLGVVFILLKNLLFLNNKKDS